MRLIDADLIDRNTAIKELFAYAESKFQSGEIELANGILKAKCFLENQENVPTAYDVDKVVEELEEYSNADEAERHGTIPVIELDDAIEIVKRGGIDGR